MPPTSQHQAEKETRHPHCCGKQNCGQRIILQGENDEQIAGCGQREENDALVVRMTVSSPDCRAEPNQIRERKGDDCPQRLGREEPKGQCRERHKKERPISLGDECIATPPICEQSNVKRDDS